MEKVGDRLFACLTAGPVPLAVSFGGRAMSIRPSQVVSLDQAVEVRGSHTH